MLFPYVCGGELFSYLRRLLQIIWLTSLIYGNLKISANYSALSNKRGSWSKLGGWDFVEKTNAFSDKQQVEGGKNLRNQ